MNYDDIVEHIVRAVEACGIAVLVGGGISALVGWVADMTDARSRADSYMRLRSRLARVILLGLEILLLADIILTIVVEPSLDSVAILAMIVLIRIVLSFSLEVEIDGTWPWNRWRLKGPSGSGARNGE